MNKGLRIVSQFLGNVSIRGKEILKNWNAFLNALLLKMWGHSTSNSGLSRGLRRQKIYRGAGFVSVCGLTLLTAATVFPLYSAAEYSEAAAGTAQDSEITFTATRSTASVDLTVTSENGTFASSTDGTNGTTDTRAAFSISTTNFTGYTLTIASNTNTSTLSNSNGGTLSSISEPIDESTFNTTTYNNKWGYKPNYYNSSANSNYLQSPTTTASTLDETDAANTTAKNYTIALGARADYTNASGTYSSSNYKLMYVANPVAYSISFDKGSASEDPSNMPAVVTGSVSALSVNLPNTVPTRTAYDFIGWCLGTINTANNVDECSNNNIYNPNGNGTNLAFGIDRESDNTGVTLHAMWKIKTFTCSAQYRLQNADGTFPDTYTPDTDNNSTVTYGSSCSYSKTVTDYKNSASGTNGAQASTSATNVTENKTLSLDFYRNTYTLTTSNGSNVSNTKFTTTAVHGDNYFRWGQAVALSTTKATDATCTTYATPTWTQSGTTGTFSSTSGTSVNFTMGKGNATVTASSTSTNVSQTVTLSKGTGVSSIKIGSSTYSGSSASLTCGSYTISGNYSSGYEFSSWSTASNVSVASTSTASTTMTVNGAGTLTLNAKSSKLWFQNATSANCGSTMYDNRGNDTYKNIAYTTAKIGNLCWMTRNLDLPGGTALTSDDTNLTTGFTLPTSSTSGFNNYNIDYVRNSSSTYNDTSCGNYDPCYSYYSFYTATAHWGTNSVSSGSSSVDICPKGWRLPTYSEMLGITSSVSSFSPVYSGGYYKSKFNDGGSYGYWWSSTVSNANNAYFLNYYNGSLFTINRNKYLGYSIRCVMKKPTMQDATASSLAALMPNTGDTATLVDSRDGEEYLIGKLADGKYWMLDNLRLGGTSAISLTTANTNSKGNFTLPASSSSGFTSYDTAMINTAYKNNTTTTGYGSGSKKIGVYYNYCAASAGTYCYASGSGTGNASYDICPKGWRMPTGGSSGEYQALYTAYSSNDTNFRAALSTPLSGYFYNSSADDQGSYGYFWSSTYDDGYYMYVLFDDSSDVDPANSFNRSNGFSVRCILK